MLATLVENIFVVSLLALLVVTSYVIYNQHKMIKELMSQKRSLHVKHGKVAEQFLPFMEHYPYDKSKFRFIGNPVDGIQFEDNKVIFIEFKTGQARLTSKQKSICELVNKGHVEFREFRI
jgi:predicted Holliday junction resolvase-like endonuclease